MVALNISAQSMLVAKAVDAMLFAATQEQEGARVP
jgi:hypothetical protein